MAFQLSKNYCREINGFRENSKGKKWNFSPRAHRLRKHKKVYLVAFYWLSSTYGQKASAKFIKSSRISRLIVLLVIVLKTFLLRISNLWSSSHELYLYVRVSFNHEKLDFTSVMQFSCEKSSVNSSIPKVSFVEIVRVFLLLSFCSVFRSTEAQIGQSTEKIIIIFTRGGDQNHSIAKVI